jgi:2-polyprenyl-3-methyl-5-hydroxy-6-metoxy-1,4-benzoquinol methylase
MASDLYSQWWYYGIELLPGIITKGQYESSIPMLPRLMLRRCVLKDMECLDLGSMEGLIPALMRRQGARRVLATDGKDHCVEKLAAVQHYYGVKFEYKNVGLMYELNRKIPDQSFDLINCSGLLYHVVSPFLVLSGLRSLLNRNGLIIISTHVIHSADYVMDFNEAGRWQVEANTFWYCSIALLDYILRYLKLSPIDCLYLPDSNVKSHIRYVGEKPSGYLSVVCRAVDNELATEGDTWMAESARHSWEYKDLIDWKRAATNTVSQIEYTSTPGAQYFRSDTKSLDLWRAVTGMKPLDTADSLSDTHILRLEDRF